MAGTAFDKECEKEFENAPPWAKLLNQKLSIFITDTVEKVNTCVATTKEAVETAKETRDLASEARDGIDELAEKIAKLELENKFLRKKMNEQENRSHRSNLKN